MSRHSLNFVLAELLCQINHSKTITSADYNHLLLASQQGQLTEEDSCTAERLLYAVRRGLIEVD